MIRVPNHPPKTIQPLRTLRDYREAGLIVVSYCSGGCGHSHFVDLAALIAERGPDVEVDFALKRSLTCPQCGAPGGGIKISDGGVPGG